VLEICDLVDVAGLDVLYSSRLGACMSRTNLGGVGRGLVDFGLLLGGGSRNLLRLDFVVLAGLRVGGNGRLLGFENNLGEFGLLLDLSVSIGTTGALFARSSVVCLVAGVSRRCVGRDSRLFDFGLLAGLFAGMRGRFRCGLVALGLLARTLNDWGSSVLGLDVSPRSTRSWI
jgi:hypothetical protein